MSRTVRSLLALTALALVGAALLVPGSDGDHFLTLPADDSTLTLHDVQPGQVVYLSVADFEVRKVLTLVDVEPLPEVEAVTVAAHVLPAESVLVRGARDRPPPEVAHLLENATGQELSPERPGEYVLLEYQIAAEGIYRFDRFRVTYRVDGRLHEQILGHTRHVLEVGRDSRQA